MNLLRQLFIYLWSLWCLLTFAIALLFLFPCLVVPVLIKNERLIYKAHFLAAWVAKMGLIVWGVQIEVRNKEAIHKGLQCVFVSNHLSYLDPLVCGAIIPNFVKYLGKAEILTYPVIGFFLKHYNIPVKREDKDNRNWSMEQMKEKLKSGCSMFICPEGTCNTTKNFFKEFRDGAFRLAIDARLPIVPLTLIHTGELMPRSQFLLRPGKVILYYHEPIPVAGLSSADVLFLKEKVLAIMQKDISEHYPNGSY